MLRALVVDDDAMNLEVAQVILKNAGHQVVTAGNGAEALACCLERGETFDLILMDHNMPVMDGMTAIRALRAHPATRAVPILMVTGSASGADRQKALEAGADRFFTKPYKRRELLEAIATTLAERGLLAAGESVGL